MTDKQYDLWKKWWEYYVRYEANGTTDIGHETVSKAAWQAASIFLNGDKEEKTTKKTYDTCRYGYRLVCQNNHECNGCYWNHLYLFSGRVAPE